MPRTLIGGFSIAVSRVGTQKPDLGDRKVRFVPFVRRRAHGSRELEEKRSHPYSPTLEPESSMVGSTASRSNSTEGFEQAHPDSTGCGTAGKGTEDNQGKRA